MGVRVEPDDLPDHLVLQHQHNLNRAAEAEAQYAPISSRAGMVAQPVRMMGMFGGPAGAALGEAGAQTIEQVGGARQGYDPMAIGGQAVLPVLAGKVAGVLNRYRQSRAALKAMPAPQIEPVPQVQISKPTVYLGPERRRSALTQAEAAEEQAARRAGRFIERRKTVGEGGNPSLAEFHRYTRGEPGAADFIETFDRTTRRTP